MAKQVTAFSVVIGSPSDVPKERDLLPRAISHWNAANRALDVVAEPLLWETHSTPDMSERAQAVINRQLIDDADMLIAIFFTRLGSGTLEEIERFRTARKPVRLYFSSVDTDASKIDLDEYARLKQFKEKCKSEGLFCEYKTLEELGELVTRHLTASVHEFLKAPVVKPAAPRPGERILALSKEAIELLRVENPAGYFVIREPASQLGGKLVSAGNQQFGSADKPEIGARYISALRELEREKFAEQSRLNIYELTAHGWDAKRRLER